MNRWIVIQLEWPQNRNRLGQHSYLNRSFNTCVRKDDSLDFFFRDINGSRTPVCVTKVMFLFTSNGLFYRSLMCCSWNRTSSVMVIVASKNNQKMLFLRQNNHRPRFQPKQFFILNRMNHIDVHRDD